MTSATSWADLNGKSLGLMILLASSTVNTTSPDLHVVCPPSGKDPKSFSGVSIGNLAPAEPQLSVLFIFFYAHFFYILLKIKKNSLYNYC